MIRKLIFILLTAGTFILHAQNIELKTLKVYSSSDQTSVPIIDASDENKNSITIEFDVNTGFIPNMNIFFRFCDKNWTPYDNAFLYNPGYNTEYAIWFDRVPDRVTGARYHYKGSFPNNNVTFPFSGKWMFFITDSQDKNKIYGSGKFYVVNPMTKIRVSAGRSNLEGISQESPTLDRTVVLKTELVLPDSLFPSMVGNVEIIQNHKIDYPVIISRDGNTLYRYYNWNGSNQFSFVARDIFPGNGYREIDITDKNKFNPPEVMPELIGLQTLHFDKQVYSRLRGGSLVDDYKSSYSDYMNVLFRLRSPENIEDPIFIVGSFTNWQVLPQYEMYDDMGMMNLVVNLKRGIYDYQYVTAKYDNDKIVDINWLALEGNYWETRNDFYVFLFYSTNEKGGYDKIIAYKKITVN